MVRVSSLCGSASTHSTSPGQHSPGVGCHLFEPYSRQGGDGGDGGSSGVGGGALGGGGDGGHVQPAVRHMVRVSSGSSPCGSASTHSTSPGQHSPGVGYHLFEPYSRHGGLGGDGGSSGGGGLGAGGAGGGGLGGHVHPGYRQTVRVSPVSLLGSGSVHSTSPPQQGSAAEQLWVATSYTGHQRFCPCVEHASTRCARASRRGRAGGRGIGCPMEKGVADEAVKSAPSVG